MVSDLALDLAFQCQGWMKSRLRTLSVDNFTLKSWNNLWNENSKFWKNRRRQQCWTDSLLIQHLVCLQICIQDKLCLTLKSWDLSFRFCQDRAYAHLWVSEDLFDDLRYCLERKHGVEHKQNLCFPVMFFSQGERHNPRYLCNVWNEWECILFLSQTFSFLRKNSAGGLERSTPAVSKCFSCGESRKRERCNQREP